MTEDSAKRYADGLLVARVKFDPGVTAVCVAGHWTSAWQARDVVREACGGGPDRAAALVGVAAAVPGIDSLPERDVDLVGERATRVRASGHRPVRDAARVLTALVLGVDVCACAGGRR
jgi:hypothetical protein